MTIEPYILNDIAPLSPQDTVPKGIAFCKKNNIDHALFAQDNQWGGSVNYYDLLEEEDNKCLKDIYSNSFFITKETPLLESIHLFQKNETNVLPVVGEQQIYEGCLLLEDIFSAIGHFPLIAETAEVLTVKISQKNYSLSEAAQLVESNNGRLYGAFVSAYVDDCVEVTLKFVAAEPDSVVETFERYGYTIVYRSNKGDRDNMLQDRYNQLMKYINV